MDVIETDQADVQVDSAGVTSCVNNYKIMDLLGAGTFSKVYRCQNDTGTEFALKIIDKSILKRKREYKRVEGKLVLSNAFQKVQKEVAIMKKLAHSNLVRLYEVTSIREDPLVLPPELAPECAELLTQLMEKNPRLRITIPQLRSHPWISEPVGELTRKLSDLEVNITQQEIEAAFTPVNNFILVMKLKMKMSSRLHNARKSLAGNGDCLCHAQVIVPVTEHVVMFSSQVTEENSDQGSELSVRHQVCKHASITEAFESPTEERQ